jgi:hypothetical protein
MHVAGLEHRGDLIVIPNLKPDGISVDAKFMSKSLNSSLFVDPAAKIASEQDWKKSEDEVGQEDAESKTVFLNVLQC